MSNGRIEMNSDSDEELARQMAEGSENAFVALIGRYRKRIFTHALTFTRRPEEAEELTQDIFIKLWQQRASLSRIQRLEDFLFILSRNLIISSIRKRILNTVPPDPEGLIDALARPDGRVQLKELEQLIADGIRRMPSQQQAVFRLSRQEGLTYEEIARRLAISKDTVKWHIMAGLGHLKKYIREHDATILTVLLCLSWIARQKK
ncbi:MAG TPA: sigma-70 family RNA polymerase sigma factor [Puia sp.]|nr:sigma-70 family RNA polymerase sigma factor [Puia sp.]